MPKTLDELNAIIAAANKLLHSNTKIEEDALQPFPEFISASRYFGGTTSEGKQFLKAYNRYFSLSALIYLRQLDKFPDDIEAIDETSPLFYCKEELVMLFKISDLLMGGRVDLSTDENDSDLEEPLKTRKRRPRDVYKMLAGDVVRQELEDEMKKLVVLGIKPMRPADVLDFMVDKTMARDDLMRHTLLLYAICSAAEVRMSQVFALLIPTASDITVDKYHGSMDQTKNMFLFFKKLPEKKDALKAKLDKKYPEVPEPVRTFIYDLFLQVMQKRWAFSKVIGVDSLNWQEFYNDYMRPAGVTVELSSERLPPMSAESTVAASLTAAPEQDRLFSHVLAEIFPQGTDEEAISPRTRAIFR